MPAKSAKQYGLMQAAAHGTLKGIGPSAVVGQDFISKTGESKRKKFAQILANKRKKRHGRY